MTYQTPKIIRVVDRKIGLMYYTICILILCYTLFYVLIHKQMYFESEHTIGNTMVTPVGVLVGKSQLGKTRVFDVGDLVKNLEETSAIFVATKVAITAG